MQRGAEKGPRYGRRTILGRRRLPTGPAGAGPAAAGELLEARGVLGHALTDALHRGAHHHLARAARAAADRDLGRHGDGRARGETTETRPRARGRSTGPRAFADVAAAVALLAFVDPTVATRVRGCRRGACGRGGAGRRGRRPSAHGEPFLAASPEHLTLARSTALRLVELAVDDRLIAVEPAIPPQSRADRRSRKQEQEEHEATCRLHRGAKVRQCMSSCPVDASVEHRDEVEKRRTDSSTPSRRT
jgi:hypothetical protein